MNQVHVALVEVEPRLGCALCADDVEGGFARCYTLATSVGSAEKAIRAKLKDQRLHVVEVAWCVSFAESEWEDAESEDAERCALEAKKTGDVVIGRLDVWGRDA